MKFKMLLIVIFAIQPVDFEAHPTEFVLKIVIYWWMWAVSLKDNEIMDEGNVGNFRPGSSFDVWSNRMKRIRQVTHYREKSMKIF